MFISLDMAITKKIYMKILKTFTDKSFEDMKSFLSGTLKCQAEVFKALSSDNEFSINNL